MNTEDRRGARRRRRRPSDDRRTTTTTRTTTGGGDGGRNATLASGGGTPTTTTRTIRRTLASSSSSSSLVNVLLVLGLVVFLVVVPFPPPRGIVITFVNGREIVATDEWQLLGENDTIPAGLHVRMDLTTGERWAKLVVDDDGAGNGKDMDGDAGGGGRRKEKASQPRRSTAIVDAGGAVSVVASNDDDDDDGDDATAATPPRKDYEMMHRVMSKLPPEELDRFGGLPDASTLLLGTTTTSEQRAKITDEQRKIFEGRMEELWNARQEELRKAQEGLADLPGMLGERIRTMRMYLDDVVGGSREILEYRMGRRRRGDNRRDPDEDENVGGGEDEEKIDDEDKNNVVRDVVDALRDLEYLLSDVDIARDFHTLGGWPGLVALLEPTRDVHGGGMKADVVVDVLDEDMEILIDEVRSLAAMTIGTAVGNIGEFRHWALEDVTSSSSELESSSGGSVSGTSALTVLMSSFERELEMRSTGMGDVSTMAVEDERACSFSSPSPSSSTDARCVARATRRLRAAYALGSLLRGNPRACRHFVSMGGPEVMARIALGTISNVRGPRATSNARIATLDYKFASRVLALGEDVVMDVILHGGEGGGGGYDDVDDSTSLNPSEMVASFATERWCDLSLRMLSPPSGGLDDVTRRGIRQRAMTAVRALAPACREGSGDDAWGINDVKRVRSEWNREGSDDGLDPVYRKELLDLSDEVLCELRE
jgi:nucleotide exchange factor SIL1